MLFRCLVPLVVGLMVTGLGRPEAAEPSDAFWMGQLVAAQSAVDGSPPSPVRLSLAEAVEAALVHSYVIRLATLDNEVANQQIRGAYSALYPQLDANASYSRTFLTPNPFAGSSAADLFSGAGTADWVTFNERATQNPGGFDQAAIGTVCPEAVQGGQVQAIPYSTYIGCFGRSPRAALLDPNANPFLVENNIRAGLSASQLIYSADAFAALRAAKSVGALNRETLTRTGQQVVQEVTSAYYRALLARASVDVFKKSVERTMQTVAEVRSRVAEGVVPQFQLLSVEVELANLETQLVTARNDAEAAEDALAFAAGIPVETELELTDRLELPNPLPVLPRSERDAVAVAFEARPDVEAAQLNIEFREAVADVTFARYLPELRLVADLAVVGNIPDDTDRVLDVPPLGDNNFLTADPFGFRQESRGVFDEDFWGTNLTAGLTLRWTLFDGFATAAQHNEDKLEIRRARIQLEQLQENVRREVSAERRNVESALERVQVQEKNVDRAELNYNHAQLRVKEGVSSQLELREASQQLDQSRFNRLQAVHDYLVGRVRFEVATGLTPFAQKDRSND